jgi:hypothetical protein
MSKLLQMVGSIYMFVILESLSQIIHMEEGVKSKKLFKLQLQMVPSIIAHISVDYIVRSQKVGFNFKAITHDYYLL